MIFKGYTLSISDPMHILNFNGLLSILDWQITTLIRTPIEKLNGSMIIKCF